MMSQSRLLLTYAVCSLVLCLGQIKANPIQKNVATEFIILHNNDMHARFEQTSVESGKCTEEMANTDKCYGGFARVAYEVRKYRQEAQNGGTPVLYLNAGDTYTGTPWFTIFKDNITAAFLNKLEPDAISLGNHELDENVEGLVPFLNAVTFPVLACNLDLRKVPELASAKHFYNSTVLDVKGVKIGVIGYLTPETKNLTVPNEVEYIEEVEAINEEAARMKAQGINIIIALGHSGYQKDQDIARKCPDVDLVIGGHTNTFLYNGDQPDAERIDGPYPTVVNQDTGKKVPVVQAYAYTKYLGKLHVQFDQAGNLIEFDGTPILLNASVPREDDVLELLEVYRPNITALETNVIGHTKVHLEGRAEICRSQECNLGNLVADAMIYARVMENQGGSYWTDAPIAFIMGGGIRSSIEKRSDGSILATDALSVLPFDNDLYMTRISGKTILNALEHSASMEAKDSNGGFLQMSGVHTTYDYNKDVGNRVSFVEVRCSECKVPAYEPLDNKKLYNVIVPVFLKDGGDGHTFTEDNGFEPQRLQKNDYDTFLLYLSQHEFVYPEVENRITINDRTDGKGNGAISRVSSSVVIAVMAVLTIAFTNNEIFEEAARIKAGGINIIIALGHSGYQKDQEIARKCPDVDLVIGGHTNTFLYNGDQPDAERIDGPYPTVVNQDSGKKVPVVQAYAYTKYLGKLHVQFDQAGNLIEFDGTPILLNASVPREDDVVHLLEVYRPNITALETNVIGHTKVHLEGRAEICRSQECNLGNLVADSMIYARVMENQGGSYWTDAPIAFINGGGIRSSIEKCSDGSILATDVLSVLPFDNYFYMTRISGRTILNALEHSASMEAKDSNGGFLQMSGVHTTYDYNKDEGNRVTFVEVRCSECKVPAYEPLDYKKLYNVIVPEFLKDGGDGHIFTEDNGFEAQRLQKNDFETILQYLSQHEFVYPEVENRITIIDRTEKVGKGNGAVSRTSSSVVIAVLTVLTIAFTNNGILEMN